MRARRSRSPGARPLGISRRALLAGGLAGLGGAACTGAHLAPPTALPTSRLPTTVRPRRYDLRLELDLSVLRFGGDVTIEIVVDEAVEEIVLNAAALTLEDARLESPGGPPRVGRVVLDAAAERARLSFGDPVTPGVWRLSLRFQGQVRTGLEGLYQARFRRDGGAEGVLAVSQFEPDHARRAFPCWDEPAFKAVFAVTLVVDRGLTALSSGAVTSERPIPGTTKKEVVFAPTIPLPTYVIALAVGEFEATSRTVRGIPVRVWNLPGKKHLAGTALEVAEFALQFLEDYYGVPYPGDKLDMIAVPDFAAGAMENHAAIFFRETSLLVDAVRGSQAEHEGMAKLVAHEIAHMWFGNLVTMRWWNGLWLKEAFATLLELIVVDAWRPRWQLWLSFALARDEALGLDGLQASRPVEFDVGAPQDAEAMFDALTYQKGAAILRMLEQHLGQPVFRRGVRRYLTRHAYGTVETADLWRALAEVSGQPIGRLMDRWVSSLGYPLVTVGLSEDGDALRFSQARFTYLPTRAPADAPWPIPLTYRVQVAGQVTAGRLLLDRESATRAMAGRVDWVALNTDGVGFYRAHYESPRLGALTDAVDALTPAERFNLVNDTWACALAGRCRIARYLDLTGRFERETEPGVWGVIVRSFAFLDRVLDAPARAGLAAFVRRRLAPVAARLGWAPQPEDSDRLRRTRADVLKTLAVLGEDPVTIDTARRLYARYRDDPSAVDPDLIAALLTIVAHAGGATEYGAFLERTAGAHPQEARRYLYALSAFRDPRLVARTLDRVQSGGIRAADAPTVLQLLLLTVHGREPAWAFVKARWDWMADRYGLAGLRRLARGLVGLSTPALETDVRTFVGERGLSLGGRTLEQYLEQLHVAVQLGVREGPSLQP